MRNSSHVTPEARGWTARAGRAGVSILAVLSLMLSAACGDDGDAGGTDGRDRVVFGVLQGGMTVLPPERLADDDELLAKYGLDVEVRHYTNLQELFPGMAAGDFDATLITASGIAGLAIQGAPVQVIATGVTDESVVLLGQGDPITTADQITGSRITALASSGTWLVMQAQIDARFNLNAGQDYEIVNVGDLGAGANQVVAGTADYALAWEPFTTAALNRLTELDVVLSAADLKDYTSWQLIVATQGDLSDDLKSRLIDALSEAGAWLEENPEQADSDYHELLDLEPGIIEGVLQGDLYGYDIHPLTDDDIASIQRDLELIVQQGGLERVPDAETFYFQP